MRRPRGGDLFTAPDFILGLDLGQASDPTALAIVERIEGPSVEESRLAVRYLKRWPLKTPYPQIVSDVADLVKQPPLSRPVLVVDETGVGRAVVDVCGKWQLQKKP